MEFSAILEQGALVFGLTEMLKLLMPSKYISKLAPLTAVLVGVGSHLYLFGYSPENVASLELHEPIILSTSLMDCSKVSPSSQTPTTSP